ncbi:MAG: hypothetical protein EOP51_32010 [Sphingobacteriales bacterium]|nr:MAG: hypothetical protein EOP51_32010 [Sphingobacteriales bacterium]
MKRILFFFSVVTVLFLASPASSVAQCAMCRATVESNVTSQESQVGAGLNSGILYLMAIPYVLIGSLGFFWYRYSKAHKTKVQAHS